MVHNAGISMRGTVAEADFFNDNLIMSVNVFSVISITKVLLEKWSKRKSGHFVIIGSVQSKLGLPLRSTYSASKHAVLGYFDALRAEVADLNIKVTSLLPGYVNTNTSKNALSPHRGRTFGKTDTNIGTGMDPSYFAKSAVEAIFFGDNEVIIAKYFHQFAVIMRSLLPEFVFWYIKTIIKKKELNAIKNAT